MCMCVVCVCMYVCVYVHTYIHDVGNTCVDLKGGI